MLKFGVENECTFSIPEYKLENIKGRLKLNEDLTFSIFISAMESKENLDAINCLSSNYSSFCMNGECLNSLFFTGLNTYSKRFSGTELELYSDFATLGLQYFEKEIKEECIKSGESFFTGLCPYIKFMNKGNIQKINCNISYSFQKGSLENHSIGGIKFDFVQFISLDEYLDLIGDINSLFSLFNNQPSKVDSVSVILASGEEFRIYAKWQENNSRNTLNIVNGKSTQQIVCDMTTIINNWLEFAEKAQIAIQQYFAIQSMNKNLYEQMILCNEIFSFEGMLTAYQNRDCNLRERFYSFLQAHDEVKKIIIANDFVLEDFISTVIDIRNIYAHCSDKKLKKVEGTDYYAYSVIVNFMVRTLLVKDVLHLGEVEIPIEKI